MIIFNILTYANVTEVFKYVHISTLWMSDAAFMVSIGPFMFSPYLIIWNETEVLTFEFKLKPYS